MPPLFCRPFLFPPSPFREKMHRRVMESPLVPVCKLHLRTYTPMHLRIRTYTTLYTRIPCLVCAALYFGFQKHSTKLCATHSYLHAPFPLHTVLGCTVASLCGGLWAFKNGKQQFSNKMQRSRVFFQGATVLAFCFGAMTETKKKRPDKRPDPTGNF